MVKKFIDLSWDENLKEDASTKSSLQYLDIESCSVSKPHAIWGAAQYSIVDSRMAVIHARLLLGTYTLQANRANFNQHAVDATCPLCNSGPEDRQHFILHCDTLKDNQELHLQDIIKHIKGWDCLHPNTKLQLILDSNKHKYLVLPRYKTINLYPIATRLIYSLHVARTRLLKA